MSPRGSGIRMVGSFHTDLAEYTRLLSGSIRLGTLMQEYMRWPYGKCDRILVPSEATQRTLIKGKINAAKIRDLETRGLDGAIHAGQAIARRSGASGASTMNDPR